MNAGLNGKQKSTTTSDRTRSTTLTTMAICAMFICCYTLYVVSFSTAAACSPLFCLLVLKIVKCCLGVVRLRKVVLVKRAVKM